MRKRIKQLIAGVPLKASATAAELAVTPKITPELLEAIMRDLDSGAVLSYEDIAKKVGCTPEKIRLVGKSVPGVIRASRPHRIPLSVYRLMLPLLTA
jgi:hypothetical protein